MVAFADLEERWGFLVPWCHVLRERIKYAWPVAEEEYWEVPNRRFEVELPTLEDKNNGDFIYEDEEAYERHLQKIREALALLTAVAHFDQTAWRYLLAVHCQVKLGEEGEELPDEEIPARFLLILMKNGAREEYPETLTNSLVFFCGTNQRTQTTDNYRLALDQIASLVKSLPRGKPGVDIKAPVQVWFLPEQARPHISFFPQIPLANIQRAERVIREDWAFYERRSSKQGVKSGSLRCTFVLEPMIAELNDVVINPQKTNALEWMLRKNVRFSQLSLLLDDEEQVQPTTTENFGRLLACLFDSDRRSYEYSNTRGDLDPAKQPLQLGTLHLACGWWFGGQDIAGICSAMVVSQTTKKVSLHLEIDADNISQLWWKWLAYALFSKRARTSSAVEAFALLFVERISDADILAFSDVLASEHPEEELCGCPRGAVDERDATLRDGSLFYTEIDNEGRLQRGSLVSASSAMRFVRCFSDDGESKLVNALVPGHGRCLVRRSNLDFCERTEDHTVSSGVTSLKLSFEKEDEYPRITSGVPRLLSTIGKQLKLLILDGPRGELAENVILLSCPNLEELALCEYFVDARLNFSDYHTKNKPLPSLTCHWDDISALAKDLSDPSNPLSRCVRRLRVRLMTRYGTGRWDALARHYDSVNFDMHVHALLQMLKVNQTVEYLDVVVPDLRTYADDFKKHHHQPVNRSIKAATETKVAFLSVLAQKEHTNSTKRPKSTLLPELDQLVLSNIFKLAATPIFRTVQFRKPREDASEEERVQLLI